MVSVGWTYAFVLLGNESLLKSAMEDVVLKRSYRMQRATPMKHELEELDDMAWD